MATRIFLMATRIFLWRPESFFTATRIFFMATRIFFMATRIFSAMAHFILRSLITVCYTSFIAAHIIITTQRSRQTSSRLFSASPVTRSYPHYVRHYTEHSEIFLSTSIQVVRINHFTFAPSISFPPRPSHEIHIV
jgi:hypothetical protein